MPESDMAVHLQHACFAAAYLSTNHDYTSIQHIHAQHNIVAASRLLVKNLCQSNALLSYLM
jgi:hypothetical protein